MPGLYRRKGDDCAGGRSQWTGHCVLVGSLMAAVNTGCVHTGQVAGCCSSLANGTGLAVGGWGLRWMSGAGYKRSARQIGHETIPINLRILKSNLLETEST